MKISASFLTIDNIDNVDKLVDCDIDYLHLDIMDGIFVNNKNEVTNISNKKPLDVHLMVNDVYKYIDQYVKLNPFHYKQIDDLLMSPSVSSIRLLQFHTFYQKSVRDKFDQVDPENLSRFVLSIALILYLTVQEILDTFLAVGLLTGRLTAG